jgi:hypothetical protein
VRSEGDAGVAVDDRDVGETPHGERGATPHQCGAQWQPPDISHWQLQV